MQTGDHMKFGPYVWRVLDVKNGAALILTEEIAQLRAYHDKPGDVTWAGCALREYLNGEFLDNFSAAEQARILPTAVVNRDNPWFGTPGGADTTDLVFLPSIEEAVCDFFGDSRENLRVPSGRYKYWFCRKDGNNVRRASAYLGYVWWWWLRSPGRKAAKAAYVHGDGNIGIQGNNAFKCNLSGVYHPVHHDVRGGVRPVLWVAL